MEHLPHFYRAEIEYRREALLRDWRPLRTLQAARAARRDQRG